MAHFGGPFAFWPQIFVAPSLAVPDWLGGEDGGGNGRGGRFATQ